MRREKVGEGSSENSIRRSGNFLMCLIGRGSKVPEHDPYETDIFHIMPTVPNESEREPAPYPYGDYTLRRDIEDQERIIERFRQRILGYRVQGWTLLVGAIVWGTCYGEAINDSIHKGLDSDSMALNFGFGIAGFVGFSIGAVDRFYHAHEANSGSQGNRDVLEKLLRGEDAGTDHSGGGTD